MYVEAPDEWINGLARWDWQWHATPCVTPFPKAEVAEKAIRAWQRDICKAEGLQVASFGLYCYAPYPHVHLLMLGKNSKSKTLMDADIKACRRLWPADCGIDPVFDLPGIAGYFYKNLVEGGDDFLDYNCKLLKAACRPSESYSLAHVLAA